LHPRAKKPPRLTARFYAFFANTGTGFAVISTKQEETGKPGDRGPRNEIRRR
jgi:hypothetical protein